MNNFDKEFNSRWETFLKTKNSNDLHSLINHIVECFSDHLDLAAHEAIRLLPNNQANDESSPQPQSLTSEEFLLAFNWPDLDHLFYFLNEEMANLNRRLFFKPPSGQQAALSVQISDADASQLFAKFLNLLKCVYVLSKNMICLNLIINTSIINQFLSSYRYILNLMHSNESIKDYFKFICFLLIKAHDPYLCWFRKYYSFDPRYVNLKPLQINTQRHFSFKFDPAFFAFLFDSLKLIQDDQGILTQLGIHTYACVLNEISSTNPGPPASLSSSSLTNLNDNLIKAVQPQIVDFLFQILVSPADAKFQDYMILNDQFVWTDKNNSNDPNRRSFSDEQLIVCRCLPQVVNILHLSLHDKRLVDLGLVLEKLVSSLERIQRDFIKLELLKSYLTMLNECSDRAALKIAIVSRKFFICLFEQIRLVCLTNSKSSNDESTSSFLHEFVRVVLNLIKNLLENSQPVKDVFSECSCYDSLYEILKECPSEVLDIEISMLINEMIGENTEGNRNLRDKNSSYLDTLENSQMAVLLIKLMPFMKPSAQEFSLVNICRLCTFNVKNQLKSCKNNMLLYFIGLLNYHAKFSHKLIEDLFRTIQILGKCGIGKNELFQLIRLLSPKNQFPYGIYVLRCLTLWAKTSTSVGINMSILEIQGVNESGGGSGGKVGGGGPGGNELEKSPSGPLGPASFFLANSSLVSPAEYNLTDNAKLRHSSFVSINQNVLNNMMRAMGTGALSQNAQQQAKYFFDFQQSNSGIRVPPIKKWPGHAFTFHCWLKLRSDLDIYDKKRRQLYSFYTDNGQGFEAFFTADCSSLVVSVCTRKEFLSVQLRELDFDSSESNREMNSSVSSSHQHADNDSFIGGAGSTTSTSDYWHSVTIVHVPAKKPFGYSQVCIYVDGVLKKEADLRLPHFSEPFSQIRIGAACSRVHMSVGNTGSSGGASYINNMSSSLVAPLKNVFGMAYKSGATEKSLSVTTIPSGSQDTVWDPSTCLMGQISSCFVLHDVISDLQVRLLYELGPNQYAFNWLDIVEMNDLKSKLVLHYDAKCTRDLTCYDLSANRFAAKFSGSTVSCDNFKESLNSIGSVQIFYPLLNYLSSNQDYLELVVNEWPARIKPTDSSEENSKSKPSNSGPRRAFIDDSELEKNIVAMVLNLIRYMLHNSDVIQDRFERNNGIALLGFLLQRLPRQFIDVHLLRVCQDLVNEASNLANKSLLNVIYEFLIFDFRIWNKADYEIRIGHIQYISTIIKDDKRYFRKKYGVQFFLDIIKTYFGNSTIPNSKSASVNEPGPTGEQGHLNDEDLRNLRSSFFGLIKYYAQKDIKISELNAIISFLSTTKNVQFQNDILDVLINLLEAPSSSDQLYLLLFEPNMAESLWSLIAHGGELVDQVEKRLFKFIRILLKTKKVYDRNKSRLRLDDCGTFAGLTSKIVAECSSKYLSFMGETPSLINENLASELIDTFLVEESQIIANNSTSQAPNPVNQDNLWSIMSLLTLSPVQLIIDREALLRARSKACDLVIKYFFAQQNQAMIRSLTRSPAWQDVVCQLFCVEKIPLASSAPPIVVRNNSGPNGDPKLGGNDDDDVWENIEYNGTNEQTTSTDPGDGDKSDLLTSTPSRRLEPGKNINNQSEFNEKLTSESNQMTSTAIKPAYRNNDLNLNQDPNQMKTNQSMFTDDAESNKNQSSFSSPVVSPARFHLDESNDSLSRKKLEIEELGVEATELYEKLIFIIYKLIWEGVPGSNEDAWKERCQIFSSLHRLSKEFFFIKPIEHIEMRLLEMSLKHCCAEAKKQNISYKEQSQVLENSRELVKLVDSFVTNNSTFSEKLISTTISLLDQIRVFDQKIQLTPQMVQTNINQQQQLLSQSMASQISESPKKTSKISRAFSLNSSGTTSMSNTSTNVSTSLLNSYGIINDEWAETSYLGMNILLNVLSSSNVEICAQASAKINTILHSRAINSCEEACYLIASVEKIMFERLSEGDEQSYAFLLPIIKCLLEKTHSILQMNVQVPNIPAFTASPTFYEDFKEYCKCDEWRIFIQKQVAPLREQYLAMTVNPCQMNMKIWWNMCYETLMVSIHKRMRSLGEAKIKFEDSLFNSWKEREKQEIQRYQTFLIQLKRTNLGMRKQLHTTLKYLCGERGPWNDGVKEVYWMLSNHENRQRMRCKLVENLKFDSHFEASRLRDYSGYSGNYSTTSGSSATLIETTPKPADQAQNLAQKLSINKEAINAQIKEDVVGEEEFATVASPQSASQPPENQTSSSKSSSGESTSHALSRTSSTSTISKTTQLTAVPIESPFEGVTQLEEKEKLLIKSDCELVTVTRVIKGRFELTNKYIYFFDTFSPFYHEHSLNDSSSNDPIYSPATNGISCQDFDILNDMKISLTQLKEVQLRRYNLRRSALEFFLINETNFFINFNKATRNRLYGKIMSMKLPNLQSYPSVRTQVDLLKATDYTQKWCNHEMTNFEYLMKLNTIAGRTYNDLSQYPIFPWILKDYTSEQIQLNDPSIYRDLSKPIGVLSKKNEDYVRQKYESFEDPTGTMRPFHYGTHYSNAANVMHYLIRLEPFTTLHIQLQSDRFDVADRQFHSIANTWRILYENPNDVKELIPEFFYLPEFLVNMNNFDFGELQMSKNKVNDVTLPKWAKSPEHFIHVHRQALESEYVSEHLHEWIDLIFGFKQQGVEAEKALNMFMYYSYEGALDLDAITDPVARRATEDMISNFGQTPTQLFKDPHPKRKTREQAIRDKIIQGKPVFIWHQILNLKAFYVEFYDPKRDHETIDPIVFLSIPKNHVRSFMQPGLSDPLISVSQTGIIGVNGWQANDRSLTNLFMFEKDPSLMNEKTKKSIAGPFDPNFEIDHRVFVLTHDSKLLISGAHWDNSIRVFNLSKYRVISQIYQHSNIVTCLAIDHTGSLLVSGSMDTTCMIWQFVFESGASVNLDSVPMHILYGHSAAVASVDISNELDIVVSAALDGNVNLHTIRTGSFVRTLSFMNEKIAVFKNLHVKLSNERHLMVYVNWVAANLGEPNEPSKKMVYELFLFSINGNLIARDRLGYPLQDMIIKNDYCILALTSTGRSNHNSSLNSSRNDSDASYSSRTSLASATSRLVFKEIFDFKTLQTMRLKAPIKCMFLTSDEGHLLVSLQDGKLIVINGDKSTK